MVPLRIEAGAEKGMTSPSTRRLRSTNCPPRADATVATDLIGASRSMPRDPVIATAVSSLVRRGLREGISQGAGMSRSSGSDEKMRRIIRMAPTPSNIEWWNLA